MSSGGDDTPQDDAITTALENGIVLQKVFSSLPFESLKQCRLVNKTWNLEAGLVIRDFKRSDATIKCCSGLYELNGIVSQMSAVVPINSLTIRFSRFNPNCTSTHGKKAKTYEELMKKVSLKHLTISSDSTFGSTFCPVRKFVVSLLREQLLELRTLEFSYLIPEELPNYFRDGWSPWLPKLNVFDFGSSSDWTRFPDFMLKILRGSPNLKKLKGDHCDGEILKILPKEFYSLVDSLTLSINSDEEETNWLQLAQAEPSVSSMSLSIPSYDERRYIGSFLRVLELLLNSSWKTLGALSMGGVNFPLRLLTFPPLIHLKKLWILSTELHQEDLINIIRSIDYPKMLPALEEVQISTICYEDLQPPANPWLYDGAASFEVHPSTTVTQLSITANFGTLDLADLGVVFPNVSDLTAQSRFRYPSSISYGDVWTSWPHLQDIRLTERGTMWRNFDAEFLGIYPEEVEALRELDEESLEKMHIVPARPSLLTLPKLEFLQISFCVDLAEGDINPEQVFLSKLTGILAFRKMEKKGIMVVFLYRSPGVASRLGHLSQFVASL